jgi:hypothetical protein
MSRAEDIIKAYEAWDPDQESATELAGRLGISKARLYQVLEEEGVPPKARRPRERSFSSSRYAFARSSDAGDQQWGPEVSSALGGQAMWRRQAAW